MLQESIVGEHNISSCMAVIFFMKKGLKLPATCSDEIQLGNFTFVAWHIRFLVSLERFLFIVSTVFYFPAVESALLFE